MAKKFHFWFNIIFSLVLYYIVIIFSNIRHQSYYGFLLFVPVIIAVFISVVSFIKKELYKDLKKLGLFVMSLIILAIVIFGSIILNPEKATIKDIEPSETIENFTRNEMIPDFSPRDMDNELFYDANAFEYTSNIANPVKVAIIQCKDIEDCENIFNKGITASTKFGDVVLNGVNITHIRDPSSHNYLWNYYNFFFVVSGPSTEYLNLIAKDLISKYRPFIRRKTPIKLKNPFISLFGEKVKAGVTCNEFLRESVKYDSKEDAAIIYCTTACDKIKKTYKKYTCDDVLFCTCK